MFQQPNYSDPGKHFSSSSSVYSTISSSDVSPQSHHATVSSSKSASSGSINPHHASHSGYNRSLDNLEQEDEEDEEEAVPYNSRLPTEPSNQTMQSYRTARSGAYSFEDSSDEEDSNYTPNHDETASGLRGTPSLSSINNSLLHNSSKNSSMDDNDETPLINSRDRYPDDTPIVNANGFLEELNNHDVAPAEQQRQLEELEEEDPSALLPKRKLSKKFKRLSVALQNTRASGDSHQFRNTFQTNVEQANRTAAQESSNSLERKSTYYAKLEEKQARAHDKQDKDAENMVTDKDHHLETSSLSTRASSIHSSDISMSGGSGSERDDSSLNKNQSRTSSNNFVFNNEFPSSYNIGGSKVKDDIPARKDLLMSDSSKSELNDSRLQSYNNSTAMLEEGGLNIVYKETQADKDDKTQGKKKSTTPVADDDDDLSEFFIRALHSFDSSTLQSESDASICLSFEKNDIAFLHNIDESGWGEVTLIDTLQTGWIPMNYFAVVITNDDVEDSEEDDLDEQEGRIPNSQYLKPLFHSCGQFLSNPLSHRNRKDKYTFSIRVINSIRDGVRLLLQQTDCLSRSNEIVTKRPVVRRSRKSLLADWYNLMVKANEFKGTSNYSKIEILTLMVYQVTRKALSFLEVWSAESKQIVTRDNEGKLYDDLNNYPLLGRPPLAKHRITEINGILNSYLGLIIGRLDLIEHNQIGCDMLETLAHQVILLLRELLFISRTGSDYSTEKPKDLDSSLDGLLSLVSDLVASVKNLVVKTINETDQDRVHNFGSPQLNGARDYYYTPEGGELIQIASRMIRAISITISSIRRLLEGTGDFKLPSERSYPDYNKMRIEPQEFIRKCSKGITTNNELLPPPATGADVKAYKANRYSMVRAGKTGNLGFTEGGAKFLLSLNNDVDNSSPFTMSAPEFEPFTTDEASDEKTNKDTDISNELLVDNQGHLLGGSFRGLVYTLTNEDSPPEYFYVSAFFICFRSFGNGIDLVEELITRFQVGVHSSDINTDLKLKKRRKLIAQMFQLWMESYWNYEADYNLLTTLINFFNEGMSGYLPLDAIKLIEVGARLSSRPLVENRLKRYKPAKQLVDRSITLVKATRNEAAMTNDMSRFSMVDSYELSKINTNSTSSSSSVKSASLPMPLGPGTSTSPILTSAQIQTIEKINLTYRAILGNSWCSQRYISSSKYIPLDLSVLMPNFFIICDQSWVLSNYRPNLLDFNGLEIAKQLTLLESHIFCSIRPDELLNQNYTTKRAHLKLAPNVRLSLLFTNCLSGYVLESILQPNITHKIRVSTVKTWLKVGISCLYLRNFNSLAAIITALESHLITRLSPIWTDLQGKYVELYDYLSSIIHPEKNYHVYRSKLRNFLMSKEFNVPIVPYFSLFLQDLTFVTDGNPNFRKANTFLNQKLINIDKYLKITRVIADIECLQIPYDASASTTINNSHVADGFGGDDQDFDYNITPVPGLQELILLELWKICQLNKTEEDRAWKLSCAIQPR
ncbi:Bud site selection protein 5 [Candida viswanathii]|uniref:Bud site selection protein 5 n=1 Tax=Candida viswanathii TaxID=5486 RepID=A0A367YBK0_9ASCO|nr:Bud site selection protein 5 [Candida viswanathii]